MKIKSLILIFALLTTSVWAINPPTDSVETAPANWFNLDADQYMVQGVSTAKAYEMLQGRKSKKVIVAVIDSGVDIEHEDLQGKIWVNEDEIPNNGKDDDQNGYVDDVHGWNFVDSNYDVKDKHGPTVPMWIRTLMNLPANTLSFRKNMPMLLWRRYPKRSGLITKKLWRLSTGSAPKWSSSTPTLSFLPRATPVLPNCWRPIIACATIKVAFILKLMLAMKPN